MFLMDEYTYLDMWYLMKQPSRLLKKLIFHFFKNITRINAQSDRGKLNPSAAVDDSLSSFFLT